METYNFLFSRIFTKWVPKTVYYLKTTDNFFSELSCVSEHEGGSIIFKR